MAVKGDYQDEKITTRFPTSKKESILQATFLIVLILSLTLSALKVLPTMKKNHHIFHPVNPKTKSLLFSAMLQCWVWFVLLYLYQFLALAWFHDVITTQSTVISTAYMPFVDIGYYGFGIMGVFYLVEFPFLLWYISTKVMAMDRRGLNRRQCMLYMLKSVVCAGMVLFMQVLPMYIVCQIVYFLTSPLFVLQQFLLFLIAFSFFTTCTALLFLPCITRCKKCLPHCCSIIFFVLCTIICYAFWWNMQREFRIDSFSTPYDLSHILTILFTSSLLALLAYIIKRVFTGAHHKAEGSSQDTCPDEGYNRLTDAA